MRGVEKGRDGALFVEAGACGEREHIDAAQPAVGRLVHQAFYGSSGFGVSRLPQTCEQRFGLTHLAMLGILAISAKAVPSGTGNPVSRSLSKLNFAYVYAWERSMGRFLHISVSIVLGFVTLTGAATAQSAPPGRIGRLAYINGPVSFHDEDQTQWAPAIVNRPLSTGDSLWTEPNARSEASISC